MRGLSRLSVVFGAVMLLAAALGAPAAAGPSDTANVGFGRDLGSGCNPPECFDDASFHADDRVVPGAVAISSGGEVTFDVAGFHQIAIYGPGVKPKDIDTSMLIADFFLDDPDGRVALGMPAFSPPERSETFEFDEPGKYLVICTVLPHFEEARMWGWVTVK